MKKNLRETLQNFCGKRIVTPTAPPIVTAEDVLNVLAEDRANRHAGVDSDLFPLSSCHRKSWKYLLPTVDRCGVYPHHLDAKESVTRLLARFPALGNVDLTYFLVAGGSVSDAVTDKRHNNDLDFFIHGICDPQEATERIQSLFKALEPSTNDQERRIVRTQNYISLFIGQVEYQVILRLYKTKSEILHGFDIGPSAIGFDGTQIWVTSLGRLSYEFGINVVDISRRSLSMEFRLKKYYDRGFALILPWLDIQSLPSSGVTRFGMRERLMLGSMCIEYRGIMGNELQHAQVHCKRAVDYETGFDMDDEIAILNWNIRALVANTMSKVIINKPGKYRYDVFGNQNFFGAGFILKFYSFMLRQLKFDGWNRRNLVYFSEHIRKKMFEHFVLIMDGGNGSVADLDYGPFITEQIDLLFTRVESFSKTPIAYRTIDPGAQFTGSFHPIATTEEEFYGKHFLKEVSF